MSVKSRIGSGNQFFIESPLICTTLVTSNQQDRRALSIKRKSHPPYSTTTIETQLFHICVLRAFERINRWPAQVGAKFLKEPGVGEQFILECNLHRLKLGMKVIVKEYVPRHGWIMALKAYYFKKWKWCIRHIFNDSTSLRAV
jgi:hypothetical protein